MSYDHERDYFNGVTNTSTSAPPLTTSAPPLTTTDESATRAPRPMRAPRGARTLIDFVRDICDAEHEPDCYCQSCDNERIARENFRWAGAR